MRGKIVRDHWSSWLNMMILQWFAVRLCRTNTNDEAITFIAFPVMPLSGYFAKTITIADWKVWRL